MKIKILEILTLTMVFLAVAIHPAGAQTDDAACAQLGWQLGITPYSFRLFPISKAIQMTAALGLKYMGLSGNINLDGGPTVPETALTDEQLAAIRQQAGAAGIKIINIGIVPLTTNEAQCRKVFEFARKVGVDTIVAEPAAEALDTVEKLCKEYQIKVAIHDHPRPSHYWNPDTVLAALKGRTPLMGACADVGHWMRSGLDPVACLRKLDGRIICLHFKDLVPDDPHAGPPPANGARKMHDVPWGTGMGNVKGMMAELKRQHFHGAFYVEYEYHWTNSSPEIAQCIKYFNATAAALAR